MEDEKVNKCMETVDGSNVYIELENLALWTKTTYPNISEIAIESFLRFLDKVYSLTSFSS